MILVVTATPNETAFLARRDGIEVLVSGIGPVEAAARTAAALCDRRYALVVNAGIAGALDPGLEIGEGVVVARERFELELETGKALSLPTGLTVNDEVTSEGRIVGALAREGFRSVRGVTVGRVTATDATALRLRQLADVESMEGFAVLRAAEIAGVAAVEVRGVSNFAGDHARSHWSFAAGTSGLERVLGALLALETARS